MMTLPVLDDGETSSKGGDHSLYLHENNQWRYNSYHVPEVGIIEAIFSQSQRMCLVHGNARQHVARMTFTKFVLEHGCEVLPSLLTRPTCYRLPFGRHLELFGELFMKVL